MTTRNQEIDNALKSHYKAITEIQATLSALSKQQEAILKAVMEKTGSGSGEGVASGDDVEGWVYHCEHFFAMDETPEGMKLMYAMVHLKGDALQWHRAYLRTRNAIVAEIQWDEYVNLTESQAISLYLKALSPDIRGMVKMFRPRSRHLTSKELEYKRAKGECFWCTEKFVPGHKCPRNQVYVIEMEDDDDEETEEIGAETEEKEHQISIHALTGLPSYSTMRVQGSVVNRQTPKGLPPTRPFDP
nr:hypothetical protein [Tanacetum cinerariifolium]